MSRYRASDSDQCLPWADLVRAIDEGRSLPSEHLRDCPCCRERHEFIAALSATGADSSSEEVGDACPDVADWAALADGNVRGAGRADLVEHLSGCEPCAALWRHLVDAGDDEHPGWEVRESAVVARMIGYVHEVETPAAAIPRWIKWVAAAAAFVAAFIMLVADPFPPIGAGNDARWRGPVSQLSVDVKWGAEEDAPTLRWNAVPEANAYRIRIWDGDGRQIAENYRAADRSPQYPIEVPGSLEDRLILWQVDALDEGRLLATSGPNELRGPLR